MPAATYCPCPRCGAGIEDGFCSTCTPLRTGRACRDCGRPLQSRGFCAKCDNPLDLTRPDTGLRPLGSTRPDRLHSVQPSSGPPYSVSAYPGGEYEPRRFVEEHRRPQWPDEGYDYRRFIEEHRRPQWPDEEYHQRRFVEENRRPQWPGERYQPQPSLQEPRYPQWPGSYSTQSQSLNNVRRIPDSFVTSEPTSTTRYDSRLHGPSYSNQDQRTPAPPMGSYQGHRQHDVPPYHQPDLFDDRAFSPRRTLRSFEDRRPSDPHREMPSSSRRNDRPYPSTQARDTDQRGRSHRRSRSPSHWRRDLGYRDRTSSLLQHYSGRGPPCSYHNDHSHTDFECRTLKKMKASAKSKEVDIRKKGKREDLKSPQKQVTAEHGQISKLPSGSSDPPSPQMKGRHWTNSPATNIPRDFVMPPASKKPSFDFENMEPKPTLEIPNWEWKWTDPPIPSTRELRNFSEAPRGVEEVLDHLYHFKTSLSTYDTRWMTKRDQYQEHIQRALESQVRGDSVVNPITKLGLKAFRNSCSLANYYSDQYLGRLVEVGKSTQQIVMQKISNTLIIDMDFSRGELQNGLENLDFTNPDELEELGKQITKFAYSLQKTLTLSHERNENIYSELLHAVDDTESIKSVFAQLPTALRIYPTSVVACTPKAQPVETSYLRGLAPAEVPEIDIDTTGTESFEPSEGRGHWG